MMLADKVFLRPSGGSGAPPLPPDVSSWSPERTLAVLEAHAAAGAPHKLLMGALCRWGQASDLVPLLFPPPRAALKAAPLSLSLS